MQNIKESLTLITPLAIVIALLVGGNALQAAWSEPTATPPNNNVDAPINVGGVDQVKTGGITVDGLIVFGESRIDGSDLEFMFENSAAGSSKTGWRMKKNDGVGNWATYINTEGSANPTYETDGYAYREKFNPNDGIYEFKTSGFSGNAGDPIDAPLETAPANKWDNVLRLFPDARVGARQYCDINGNNCFVASDVSVSQAWAQYTSPAREADVSYQNNTGSTIAVSIRFNAGGNAGPLQVSTDNSTWIDMGGLGSTNHPGSSFTLVPPGHYYRVVDNYLTWAELR